MESKNEIIKGKKTGEFWTQKEIELVKTEYLKNLSKKNLIYMNLINIINIVNIQKKKKTY